MKLLNTNLADLRFGAGLSVGAVRGLSITVTKFALASLIFGGMLSDYFVEGCGLILVGSAVMAIAGALRSDIPGSVVGTPMAVSLIFVVTGQALPLEGRPLFMTFVAFIIISAFICGALMYLLGRFNIARLLRFVPYEIAAGSLAGIGVLAVLLGLRLCGLDLRDFQAYAFTDFAVVLNWSAALVYGSLLIYVSRVWRSFLLMPLSFGLVCVAVHLILATFNIPFESAREAGFFLDIGNSKNVWPPFSIQDFELVDWQVLILQVPNFLALIAVLLIVTVVGNSGLELSANSELNWDREFRISGTASMLSAAVSGLPGALLASITLQHQKLHAATPITSITLAVVMLLFVFFGIEVVRYIPVPALGGILIQIGWFLISDWLLANRKRLPNRDFGIVCAVCLGIVLFGYLRGIGIGIAITVGLFLIRLSNVSAINRSYSLEQSRSRKTRSVPDQAILRDQGNRAWLYELRGYIFFGSAQSLFSQVRNRIADNTEISCTVFDLSATSGFDLSAIDALVKFIQFAESKSASVVISGAPNGVQSEIKRSMEGASQEHVYWEVDEDRAIERAEDLLIEDYTSTIRDNPTLKQDLFDEVANAVERRLQRQSTFESLIELLRKWGEVKEYGPGEVICSSGHLPPGIQFVTSGEAVALDDSGTRLFHYSYGDAIEARAGFQTYATTITTQAATVCQTVLISRKSFDELAGEDSQLAFRTYRFLMQNNALSPVQ